MELKVDTHVSQAIKFLKDKGVLADDPDADVKFARLEDPEKAKGARAKYAAAQKRLLSYLEPKQKSTLLKSLLTCKLGTQIRCATGDTQPTLASSFGNPIL